MRKRDKVLGPDGHPIRIDIETLRASTRAANEKENALQQQNAQKQASSSVQQQHHSVSTGERSSDRPNPSQKNRTQSSQVAASQAQYSSPYSYVPLASGSGSTVSNAGLPPQTSSPSAPTDASQPHPDAPASGHSWVHHPASRSYAPEQSQSFMRTTHTTVGQRSNLP